MGVLIQQLETAAHILGSAGDLVQVHVVCELGEQPFVRLHTPHQLAVADQRSAVDRVAAVLGEVPLLQPVFTGRHGASVRGVREGVEIVAVTNAAIPDSVLPQRTTTTHGTIAVLRAVVPWACNVEAHVHTLAVHDLSTRYSVAVDVTDGEAAEAVLAGLVRDKPRGRARRALLPTGHSLTVRVISL
ncbi:hypothetical protein [Streptomyces sp. GQFP]|uniref:hypothetical protein n=1 Tax=Streptomyces sp. GQFP TaxID=2907545 RepID=UPI001F42DED9|nr:hypothetical protein [Streptomyces sp. GQFP]UIX34453.1 hypothetical protein LUX31_33090 [Streptomyces sp. GQFP]